jgi:hypothetical protein
MWLYQTQVFDEKQFDPLLEAARQKKHGQLWCREL